MDSFWQYSSDKQYLRSLSWLLSMQFDNSPLQCWPRVADHLGASSMVEDLWCTVA